MASATVFVDDAVLGRLPPVCVIDGVPTDRAVTLTETLPGRGLGIAWILVVLGPLAWIVLILMAATRTGERLAVQLPMSEGAYRRERRQERSRLAGYLVAAGSAIAVFYIQAVVIPNANSGFSGGPHSPSATAWFVLQLALVALGSGGLITALFQSWDLHHAVRIGLDASRRWVTLRRVHPNFAAAVAERQSATF